MSRLRCLVIALPLLAVAPLSPADEPSRPGLKKPTAMQKKLAAAQKLLGALALNDLPTIKENAEALNDLSKQEAWKRMDTPRYEQYSDEFQRLTLRMANQAAEKNLDGAALSYVDMTLICIKCHQHVRERKVGMAPPANPFGGALGR